MTKKHIQQFNKHKKCIYWGGQYEIKDPIISNYLDVFLKGDNPIFDYI
jgi:hypothetical protein